MQESVDLPPVEAPSKPLDDLHKLDGQEGQDSKVIVPPEEALAAGPALPRLDVFLEKLNVGVDKLTDELKDQYKTLVSGRNKDDSIMSKEEYSQKLQEFLADLKTNASQVGLTEEAHAPLDQIIELITKGEINSEEVMASLRGYVNTNSSSSEQQQEANEAINDLKEGVEGNDYNKTEGALKRLLNIFKALAFAILAFLGISVWKGSGEMRSG